MNAYRYNVRRINLLPLAKFGCLLGGLAMLGPGVICAVVSLQAVSAMRSLLEDWQTSVVDPLGLGVPLVFDFIELLSLGTAQALLIRLDEQGLVLAILIILSSVVGGGLLIGLTILVVGWAYNLLAALTGGLEVELRA